MKDKKNILLKVSIIVNILLIFFGIYITNLYYLQIVGLGLALLSCTKLNLKIKSDTKIWLIFIIVSILSTIIADSIPKAMEIAILIIMAILLKIIYENNSSDWPMFLIKCMWYASGVHVFATIIQAISPNIISSINNIILGSEGLIVNQRLLNAGSYAGITAQTGVNAFYIAIFIGISFLKLFFQKENKILNFLLFSIGIIGLFLTAKRGMLLFVFISIVLIYIYIVSKNKGQRKKYFLTFFIIITICFIVIRNVPAVEVMFTKIQVLEEENNILNGRDRLWEESIEIFKNNILFGIGLGGVNVTKNQDTHNVYIQLLAETGITGFLIYISALGYSLIISIKKAKVILSGKCNSNKIVVLFSIYIQLIFIMYSASENPLYNQLLLLPYVLSISITDSLVIINNSKIQKIEQ